MKLELKIVSLLSRNIERTFTINGIARSLDEYYSFVHRTIGRLIKEGILIKNKAGNSYLCSLNLRNEKAIALIQLSEIEKRDEFFSKNKEMKLLLEDFTKSVTPRNIITIVLFGSYAKGNATKESDIDILIVGWRKTDIDKITKELYAKYGKEINIVMMTSGEFKKQKGKAIIKEIIANHYVLFGTDNFVKLVLG